MNIHIFRNEFEKHKLFCKQEIITCFPDFDFRRLVEWQKKEYIIKIRNMWYCLSEFLNYENAKLLTANKIYSPSYISLKYSLSYYNLIPEVVMDITSVTSVKNISFKTPAGNHFYYKLKPSLYFGYRYIPFEIEKDITKTVGIRIAVIEKAILDFFYLYSEYNTEEAIKGLRFDEYVFTHDVNQNMLFNYLERYKNKALDRRIKMLMKIYG